MAVSNEIQSNVRLVKSLLKASGTVAKKRLGQNFLVDESVLKTIVDASEISRNDTIIEIGPGLGILTERLARLAQKVIAIELDIALASFLASRLNKLGNVAIVNQDILRVDLSKLLDNQTEYKIVANLPYYITSPTIHKIIYSANTPKLMVVTVQKEVAENIIGKNGNLSAFAVSLRIFASARIIQYIKATSFYPVPKVDSAIVRFDFFAEPEIVAEESDSFSRLVRCGFRSPRKQIGNSLAQGLFISTEKAKEILNLAGINFKMRPGMLNFTEWKTLYEIVKKQQIKFEC